ncbi:hypothetical protein [Rheinheimera sp. 4Y26]|uniref:hypothetical protein n=1 Tax=Rheinheimera sp. 4Y26 TaxID=2977811 RepID=UPI0021B13671|nr:hypothetical protein [Rheinheimera sp. 4Y26]MCT6698398.1 hypothetical protein [Rheinheimera sp. 4Y26]
MQKFMGLLSGLACVLFLGFCCGAAAQPADARVLDAEELKAKVVAITDAQNKVMLKGSSQADVDALFAMYHADFVYQHQVYGGEYSREKLYANTLRLQAMGKYNLTAPRYQIQAQIPGYNAVAVQRMEMQQGAVHHHLAVFEFRGDKVSRIIEYWQ